MAMNPKPNPTNKVDSSGSELPEELIPEPPSKLLSIDPELWAWRRQINENWRQAREAIARRDEELRRAINAL